MTRYSPVTGTEIAVESGAGWSVFRSTRDGELCEVSEMIADADIITRDGEPVAIGNPRVVEMLKRAGRAADSLDDLGDQTGLLGSVAEALEEMREEINAARERGEMTGFDFQPVSFAIGEIRDIVKDLGKLAKEISRD